MIVDEVTITIQAGKGGDGCVAFRREKFVPKGGPWGGNGGKGGDVYFNGTSDLTALKRFRFEKKFHAQDGGRGMPATKTGKNGKDLILNVPIGTVIHFLNTNQKKEITKVNEKILVAQGGKGGRGNWEFRSSTNRTPREFEYGQTDEKHKILLELQMIADIGLIGLPSVGKSSLLNELTNAHVETAAYHFTTLEPNLGTINDLILADLPGLIDGASKGKGLGHKFLKHIQRTRALAHCISCESENPKKDYQVLRKELGEFNKKLLEKPEIIVLTKTDLIDEKEVRKKKRLLTKLRPEVIPVSIYDFDSLENLKSVFLGFEKK